MQNQVEDDDMIRITKRKFVIAALVILLAVLALRAGTRVVASDLFPQRLKMAGCPWVFCSGEVSRSDFCARMEDGN